MLQQRDQHAILSRLQAQMKKQKLDALILTSPDGIFYATGYGSTSLYETGKIGMALAVVPAVGNPTVICSEFELQAAASTTTDVTLVSYATWIYIEDYAIPGMVKEVQPDLNKTYRMAADVLQKIGGCTKIGVEADTISHATWEFLATTFGGEHLSDCTRVLVEARAIKTPWEIEMLRLGAHYSELAMLKTARTVVPGMTEADVFQIYQQACREHSPFITKVGQAHTIGTNFAPAFIPRITRIERGDIIRLDGGPAMCGYNADLARSFVVGQITNPRCEEIYAALWKGYETGINMIAPGVRMCDVFFAIQNVIKSHGMADYVRGHHGHSIGCSRVSEEAPFISPNEERVFEPGMVFCIEIPWYGSKNHSYNIEDAFLITETGIELFSKSSPSLYL